MPLCPAQHDQIVDMVVVMDEARRDLVPERQDLAPGGGETLGRIGRRRSTLNGRPVPVEEAARPSIVRGLVEERQRVQLLQRKAPAQLDQEIDGELVEMFLGFAPRQRRV